MSAPADVHGWAPQNKGPTVRHPEHGTAERAPPPSADTRHRTSAFSPTHIRQRTFQFQEIKHP